MLVYPEKFNPLWVLLKTDGRAQGIKSKSIFKHKRNIFSYLSKRFMGAGTVKNTSNIYKKKGL
jgi:hypothetical protein